MRNVAFIVFITALLASTACSAKKLDVTEASYAFVDVSVIAMRDQRIAAHQTVVIQGDRVVRLGPASSIQLAPGVKIIDGKGRYLLPGLADMHVHLFRGEQDLALYVANGVTLVRNMWGSPATLELRSQVESGAVLGPSIVTAGPLIDGDPPIHRGSTIARTPDDARRLVAEQKAAGYDFIKIYSRLTADVFDAFASTAREAKIPFAGHVPSSVSVEHAMRSGMASMEHLLGFDHATARSGVDLGQGRQSDELIEIGRRLATHEATVDQLFDPARTRALGKLAAETGSWITPTLVVIEKRAMTRAEMEQRLALPQMRYIQPSTRAYWSADKEGRPRNRTDVQRKALQGLFAVELQQVALLQQAGAPLLAGSDAPNPFVFPGFAIHDELDLLVRAGLTPYEAITTATRNPARFLDRADLGTIATGSQADLLLVRENPLENVARLRHPVGVMLRGRWLPEEELHKTLDGVAASVGVASSASESE